MLTVFRREFIATSIRILLWCVALILVMALYASFYPIMGDEVVALSKSLPKNLSDALGYENLGTGSGWMHSTFFSILGYFVYCGAGIAWGASSVAGEEEAGVLELTLAHGISRSSIYWQRVLLLFVRFLVIGSVLIGFALLVNKPAQLEIEAENLMAEVVCFTLLSSLWCAVAMSVGAATGRKGIAAVSGSAILVVSYLLEAIGKGISEVSYLRDYSPMGWLYKEIPLLQGWNIFGISLVFGLTILFIFFGWMVFSKRDLRS